MQHKIAGLLGGLLLTGIGLPTYAQTPMARKPGLYTYEASWALPRAKWTDFEKPNAVIDKMMADAVSKGTLVAYGTDKTEVHSPEGATHDSFWSSMSMAGLLDALDSLGKGPPDPIMLSATKHWDAIYVSHYYDWKAGAYKGAYSHAAYYKFKSTAPDDALDTLSQHFIVPLMEKLLAEGSIVEYEVDEEAIHTESPNGIWVLYISPNSTSLDKVTAAVGDAIKANAFLGPALDSAFESDAHRDYLSRTNATFK